MFKIEIIGNLGADAELHSENGNEFVTFKVAHNERRQSADGQQRDEINWFSCSLNGKNENLLPYLKKGTCVFVRGDGRLKQYHSEKQHRLMPGCDCFVREIQLVGGKVDNVPSRLYDADGVEYKVNKWFHVPECKVKQLYGRDGIAYPIMEGNWVMPPSDDGQDPANDPADATQEAAQQPAEEQTNKKAKNAK